MTTVDWTTLAGTVRALQGIMIEALDTGDVEFLESVATSTEKRVARTAETGMDLTDETTLYTYCTAYLDACAISHLALHTFDFQTDDPEMEPEEQCLMFFDSVSSNLLPLLALMPLHLVLGHEDWNDDEINNLRSDK